jgi:hypothetical protein
MPVFLWIADLLDPSHLRRGYTLGEGLSLFIKPLNCEFWSDSQFLGGPHHTRAKDLSEAVYALGQ